MKVALATRIAVPLIASAVVAGALVFAYWPTPKPKQTAPDPSSGAPPAAATAPAPGAVTEAVETLKGLTNQVGPKPDRPDRAPTFDVARIEPSGEAVIAGHASPGATVELLRGGVAHDRTVADSSGDFVLVPKRLPAGNYDLTLRATRRDGKVSTSQDSVAVALRSGGEEKPVVALVAPDKPAVVLSKPTIDEAAAAIAIETVEGETGGRLYVSGRAAPGARVRLYLNDAYIASATASADGRLAFSIRSGIKPGNYRVRLDQVDAAGRVQARAEVPFNAPATVAAPASPEPAPPKPVATPPKLAAKSADSTPTPARGAASGPADKAQPPAQPAAQDRPQPPSSESTPPVAKADPPAMPKPAASQTSKPPAPQATESAASQAAPAPRDNASTAARDRTSASADRSSSTLAASAGSQQPRDANANQQPVDGNATPPAPPPADRVNVVVVPSVETTIVIRGDNLWNISRTTYGRGARYSVIYNANRDQIRDPDLIYPGQIFVLPNEPVNE